MSTEKMQDALHGIAPEYDTSGMIEVNEDIAWKVSSWVEPTGAIMYLVLVIFKDENGEPVVAREKAVGDPMTETERTVLPELLARVMPLLYDPAYRAEVAGYYRQLRRR